jgi:hypothetical protein
MSKYSPITSSILITPIALFLAMASAGAGHGDFVLARILFPIPMMLVGIPLVYLNLPLLGFLLAPLQFPFYGVIVKRGLERGRLSKYCGVLVIIHALAIVPLFIFRW